MRKPRLNYCGWFNLHELALCVLVFSVGQSVAGLPVHADVEQWGMFELALAGPADGNPFRDVQLSATIGNGTESFDVAGFYDGKGIYRIRFMPNAIGDWRYTTFSNRPELHDQSGEFHVAAPSADNHGPVHVQNTFYFAYADGMAYHPFGTTCYAWLHQSDALQERTLKTLAGAPFNKLRMCVFPKRYSWNVNEPSRYPFEGTPPNHWDFARFNPEFFQHLERQISRLQDLGIEADLILFHPYDSGHWGFDRMPNQVDDAYVRYIVSRLSAFRNVWWALANEYDFMKTKQESDWDRLLQLVASCDPHQHLRSIHNGSQLYNHTHPWITHASIQNGSAVEDAGRAVLYRDVYRKPIIFDEAKYEGNIPKRWGNLSPEEMVHRFWQGTIAGTYVGHGECYLHPEDILWWSKGGILQGQSPARIAFLRRIVEAGPETGVEPIDKWQVSHIAGRAGQTYFVYFGRETPHSWLFELPQRELKNGMQFCVDVIDTWTMEIRAIDRVFQIQRADDYRFVDHQAASVELPGKPWMALRIRRVEDQP